MPDILTPEQVAECRERAERATEGPWEALGDEIVTYAVPRTASHPVQTVAMSGVYIEEADAEFIAHARVDIPALCATVEALREVVEWQCRTKCAGYSSECTDRCRAAQVFRARELSR